MQDDPNQKATLLSVCLQEYSAGSAAIAEAIKRIETVRGLYLVAVFAVVGALFSSKTGDAADAVSRAEADPYVLAPVLLLPLLNSILLIYVVSSMHFILAMAKYNTYVLGPKLSENAGSPVLQFDIWTCENKDAWLLFRTLSGVLFFLVATGISVAVLAFFGEAGKFSRGLAPGLAYVVSLLSVCATLVTGGVSLLVSSRFHATQATPRLKVGRSYWLCLPIAVVLYVILAWLS